MAPDRDGAAHPHLALAPSLVGDAKLAGSAGEKKLTPGPALRRRQWFVWPGNICATASMDRRRGAKFSPAALRCLRRLGFDSRGGIARRAVMPFGRRKMSR